MSTDSTPEQTDFATLRRLVRDTLSASTENLVLGRPRDPDFADFVHWFSSGKGSPAPHHSDKRGVAIGYADSKPDGCTETGWRIMNAANDAELKALTGKLMAQAERIEELESSLQTRTAWVRMQESILQANEAEIARLRIELERVTKAAAAEKVAHEPQHDDWLQPNPLPRGIR